jgi:hypothetical protein
MVADDTARQPASRPARDPREGHQREDDERNQDDPERHTGRFGCGTGARREHRGRFVDGASDRRDQAEGVRPRRAGRKTPGGGVRRRGCARDAADCGSGGRLGGREGCQRLAVTRSQSRRRS